jgi:hypothetical protein
MEGRLLYLRHIVNSKISNFVKPILIKMNLLHNLMKIQNGSKYLLICSINMVKMNNREYIMLWNVQ